MSSPVGHSVEDMAVALAKLKGITVDDALKFLGGKAFADQAQNALTGMIGRAGGATKLGGAAGRLAGSKLAHGALRAVPVIGAGLSALDVADVVTNNTSLGNKAMDTTAMAIGGALGSVAGPLGTMGGVSTGKFVSDGLQYLFGDKKTPEQRKMEEALAMLQGGRY